MSAREIKQKFGRPATTAWVLFRQVQESYLGYDTSTSRMIARTTRTVVQPLLFSGSRLCRGFLSGVVGVVGVDVR